MFKFRKTKRIELLEELVKEYTKKYEQISNNLNEAIKLIIGHDNFYQSEDKHLRNRTIIETICRKYSNLKEELLIYKISTFILVIIIIMIMMTKLI